MINPVTRRRALRLNGADDVAGSKPSRRKNERQHRAGERAPHDYADEREEHGPADEHPVRGRTRLFRLCSARVTRADNDKTESCFNKACFRWFPRPLLNERDLEGMRKLHPTAPQPAVRRQTLDLRTKGLEFTVLDSASRGCPWNGAAGFRVESHDKSRNRSRSWSLPRVSARRRFVEQPATEVRELVAGRHKRFRLRPKRGSANCCRDCAKARIAGKACRDKCLGPVWAIHQFSVNCGSVQ